VKERAGSDEQRGMDLRSKRMKINLLSYLQRMEKSGTPPDIDAKALRACRKLLSQPRCRRGAVGITGVCAQMRAAAAAS